MQDEQTAIEIQWLQQARCGDYDAYENLYRSLAPPLRRFVRRLIGESPEVDDVVQDTLIALYNHMDKIDPLEKLRPYVFRIARNRCYDTLRKQGRYDQVSLDDEPTRIRVSFKSQVNRPEDLAHWMLLYLDVQEAMDSLPELQRQALILFSEEDMSYAEIAQVMEVSIGTVKSRLFHAKKALRRLLPPETLAAIYDEI